MNLKSKKQTNQFKYALVVLFSLILCLAISIIRSEQVHAAPSIPSITNELPDSGDFTQGNSVDVVVAKRDGVNYLLDAEDATVRVYTRDPSGRVTIKNGGRNCVSNA